MQDTSPCQDPFGIGVEETDVYHFMVFVGNGCMIARGKLIADDRINPGSAADRLPPVFDHS